MVSSLIHLTVLKDLMVMRAVLRVVVLVVMFLVVPEHPFTMNAFRQYPLIKSFDRAFRGAKQWLGQPLGYPIRPLWLVRGGLTRPC
jgi:hypothetical protein